LVYYPVGGKKVEDNAAYHYRGNKMRQITDGLYGFFPHAVRFLVQAQGEYDRGRKGENNLKKTQYYGVLKDPVKGIGMKKIYKMLKAVIRGPGTFYNTVKNIEVFEGY
jgi:hypothetical protein